MNLINVICGTSFNRTPPKPIDPTTTTLRTILDEAKVDYTHGQTNLDGRILSESDLDRTFAHFGKTSGTAYLLNVAKQDNA